MIADITFKSEGVIEKLYKKNFSEYQIFEREIFWFQKLDTFHYFPSIIDIDYKNQIIHLKINLQDHEKKNYTHQISDILNILKENKCQLNNIESNDIYIIENKIFLISFYWCIDLNININEQFNFWKRDNNTYQINRSNFTTNKFILTNIIRSKNNIQDSDYLYLLYIENYNLFLKYRNKISKFLENKSIIILKDNQDYDKIKTQLDYNKKNKNCQIKISKFNNILEDIDLLKYIISNFQVLSIYNIHINNQYDTCMFNKKSLSEESMYSIIESETGILVERKDFNYNGIFGNLEFALEIKNLCNNNNIDFKYFINDYQNIIDWNKYKSIINNKNINNKSILSEEDIKIYWITQGINENINIPLKDDKYIQLIPIKLLTNNFIVNIEIFYNILNNIQFIDDNSLNSQVTSQFLLYILNYFNKKTIIFEE